MSSRSLRGRVIVAGVGESGYYRRGEAPAPEFLLVVDAIEAACADAGIPVGVIDGFASYSGDRSYPSRLAAALGLRELRFSNLQWESGGGGVAGAVGNAAAAVATGMADCVVVFRGLAQGQFSRFGRAKERPTVSGEAAMTAPYGVMSWAQLTAMRTMRFLHERGVDEAAMRTVALVAYHHAQNNPRAVMRGRPLSPAEYDDARWITEPFRLYDCCQENDGAAAMLLVAADRKADLAKPGVYLLAAAQGASYRAAAPVHNDPEYGSAGFATVAPRLFDQAGVEPADVDVVQSYENFTGGVVMSLIEHGLCAYEEAKDFFTFENLVAPTGGLPLNTSGGNLAECYVHGLGLQIEAVRQLRGESPNQVPAARVALATGGPMVPVVSSALYGTAEVLG